MRVSPFIIAILLGSALVPVRAAAATPGPAGSASADRLAPAQEQPGTPAAEFSVEASLVSVNAVVTDEDGRVISGLKKENFRVLDNGTPQQILHFSPSTAPITIVMLLEYSSSAYQYYAQKAASWGAGFLDHVEPRDWVALVTYNMNSTVRVDFTHNLASVRDAIASLSHPTFREANMFDALQQTLDKLEPVRGRKSILLFATGANSFSASTFDEVEKRLKASDVTLFAVGLAEEEEIRSRSTSIGYMHARAALNSFAGQTGGIAFFPRFPAELPDIFRSITGYLRSEYTFSFSPPKTMRDGKYHRLEVQVVGPDGKRLTVKDNKGRERKLTILARPGYTAPPANPAP